MICRYLLMIGGERDARMAAADRAMPLGPFLRRDLDAASTLLSTSAPGGQPATEWPVVFGEIFRKARQPGSAVVAGSSPSTMLDEYWGRYVAIWRQPDGAYRVLREPSGGLPCYYRFADGSLFLASDLELLETACPLHRHLDWQEISRILAGHGPRGSATGIIGISELPAGDMLLVSSGRSTSQSLWDPWRVARRKVELEPDLVASELRETIAPVLAALSPPDRRAIALVSGGLDSSIVATMLANLGIDLVNLTLATADPGGDERGYARILAQATGGDYVERLLETSDVDLGRSQAAHLPRPVGRAFAQAVDRVVRDISRDSGIATIFTGTGGDNVFCFLQSATPAADRLLTEGISATLKTIGDVARLNHASYGEVTRAMLKRVLPWRRTHRWKTDLRFAGPSLAVRLAERPRHPWLDRPPGARIGTGAHLVQIMRSQNDTEGLPRADGIDVVHPLLSQPVVECCLAIPSWFWCEGGVDRAVARRAFTNMLPPAILRRRWKGGPDGFVMALVERHRGILHSRLLGGMLAEKGLLDRGAIAATLSDPRPVSGPDAIRLLTLSDAEAWVREKYQG